MMHLLTKGTGSLGGFLSVRHVFSSVIKVRTIIHINHHSITTTSTAAAAAAAATAPVADATVSASFAPTQVLNIFYDSKCILCLKEISFLSSRDTGNKIIFTDIEDPMSFKEGLDPIHGSITYEEAMRTITAVRLIPVPTPTITSSSSSSSSGSSSSSSSSTHMHLEAGEVLKGLPVFIAAYELVNLGFIYKWTKYFPFMNKVYNYWAKHRTVLTRGGKTLDELVGLRNKRLEEQLALALALEKGQGQGQGQGCSIGTGAAGVESCKAYRSM